MLYIKRESPYTMALLKSSYIPEGSWRSEPKRYRHDQRLLQRLGDDPDHLQHHTSNAHQRKFATTSFPIFFFFFSLRYML